MNIRDNRNRDYKSKYNFQFYSYIKYITKYIIILYI